MDEGDRYFGGRGKVHETLRVFAQKLSGWNAPYAVIGTLAFFQHGFRQFTTNVDVLVTPRILEQIHNKIDAAAYVSSRPGSRHLIDVVTGVRIKLFAAGEYPGDTTPKSVAFPDPEQHSEERNRLQVLSIAKLLEIKLASGTSHPHRLKDLGHVAQAISSLKLPRTLANQLHSSVRETYLEFWEAAQQPDPHEQGSSFTE